MEPEDNTPLTRQEVLELHRQNVPISEILNLAGARVGLDPQAVMQNRGLTDLQALRVLVPRSGELVSGEGEGRVEQPMRLDMEALEGRTAGDIAAYMSDMMGFDYKALQDRGLSNDQIIATLGDPESVQRVLGGSPLGGTLERFGRGTTRMIPSILAALGAGTLAAPSGPAGVLIAGGAAGAAAIPVGESLEEAVYGPRVPLVPGQQFGGRIGDIASQGVPFAFAPWLATQALRPQYVSFLANRLSGRLTPMESIAVQNITRPGTSLSAEMLALGTSAVAGATAERMFPDSNVMPFLAELTAGMLTPAQTISEVLARGASPVVRGLDAAYNQDLTRLSRRVVMRAPEDAQETPEPDRLFDLTRPVDRGAVETLERAGWARLPAIDPATGLSNVMQARAETGLSRLVAALMRDFREDPIQTANALNAARSEPRGLRQLAAEYGLDPETIPERLPVAGMVDSPTLRAIYATIPDAASNAGPTTSRGRAQDLVRGFEGIEQLVRIMAQTGDPQDFADAMALQVANDEAAIESMLDANLARVTNAVSRLAEERPGTGVDPTSPTANQRAGRAISETISESLGTARRQETQLWSQVDREMPVELSRTAETVQDIMRDLGARAEEGDVDLSQLMSPRLRTVLGVIDAATRTGDATDAFDADDPMALLEQMLAQEAREFTGEAGATPLQPTVGNALVIKRNLFDNMLAARSAANPDFGNARYYEQLYSALMDDLGVSADSVATRGGVEELSPGEMSLLRANSFSRALNDVFTRSFSGTVNRRDAVGNYRRQPELLGREILSGRGDPMDLAMRQLDDAVTFVVDNVPLPAEAAAAAQNRVDTLRGNQETLLRVLALQTVDAETGEVNLNRLRSLTRSGNPSGIAAALERFPDLRLDLENAETAQTLLRDARNAIRANERGPQEAFQAAIRMPPADTVRTLLGFPGERPEGAVSQLRNLVRLANQNGGPFADIARDGLTDTLLDQALVYAGRNTDNFNFEAMRQYLFSPLNRRGGDSIVGVLRDENLLNERQALDLSILLRDGQTIQRALSESRTDSELRQELAAVSPFRIGLIGRFLGAAEAQRITNLLRLRSSIQASGVGANVGEALFNRIPRTSMQDVVVQFLDDAEFAELILRRSAEMEELRGNRAVQAADRLQQDLRAALVRNGLISAAGGQSERLQREGVEVPFARPLQAATFDTAPLEAYLQSVQQAAPAPATPAPPPGPTTATPSAGAPPPAVLPAAPPATQAGGQSRASYSALFPNDPIAPLMQQRELQQGIGSLVGPR
jgi:hypothetical protein